MFKNWKTTLSGSLATLAVALTFIAALPSYMDGLGSLVPEDYKNTVIAVSGTAAFVLKIVNALVQADAPKALPVEKEGTDRAQI